MKITLYTVTDCQFSKQEKEYFTSHTLTFEEKNLETNRDFLTEMLTLSNNFAGTPVTKIEKDDGQIVVLKGFTKEEFDKALGYATEAASPPSVQSTPQPVQQTPPQPAPQAPISEPDPAKTTEVVDMPAPVAPTAIPTAQPTVTPPQQPQSPQPPQTPISPPVETPNPMSAVLNNLQDQATAAPPLPNIPDPKL